MTQQKTAWFVQYKDNREIIVVISITDESTQTKLHSDEQALHKPTTLMQIRERLTQTISNFIGRQLTPTKYLIDTEETRTLWNKCTTVRSPYIRGKLSYKTEFKDGSVSFSVIRPGRPNINRSLPRLHHRSRPW